MFKTCILIGLLLLSSCTSSTATRPESPTAENAVPGQSAPPKDAQFTIFCFRVLGAGHVQRATNMRDELKKSTGMKDWYVIIENDQTLLYYGYYRAIEDTKAQQDRKKIDTMSDKLGNRPFRQAMFVELTAPDPTAPPEWNLLNTQGTYTLQIGVYKGSPQRKEAAVMSVREARAQGIEAYYYHGETASLVCVGAWPASAVLINDGSAAVRNTDPSRPLIYAPMTGDQETNQAFDDAARQTNAKLIRPQVQILDPTLEAMRRQFPYNTVNGNYMKRVVEGREEFDHSLIYRITRPKTAATPQQAAQPASNQPAYDPNYRPQIPRQTTPTPPAQQPGSGRLRSIGD